MTLKLAILKSGEDIICDIKEGIIENKVVCYIFQDPYRVTVNGKYKLLDDEEGGKDCLSISLYPWPTLSEDKTVELVPDWIVTLVNPTQQLKDLYEKQVLKNGQECENITFDEQSDADLTD
jgi:hypothetical protein